MRCEAPHGVVGVRASQTCVPDHVTCATQKALCLLLQLPVEGLDPFQLCALQLNCHPLELLAVVADVADLGAQPVAVEGRHTETISVSVMHAHLHATQALAACQAMVFQHLHDLPHRSH